MALALCGVVPVVTGLLDRQADGGVILVEDRRFPLACLVGRDLVQGALLLALDPCGVRTALILGHFRAQGIQLLVEVGGDRPCQPVDVLAFDGGPSPFAEGPLAQNLLRALLSVEQDLLVLLLLHDLGELVSPTCDLCPRLPRPPHCRHHVRLRNAG